jgi:hypothetical protein
MGKSGERRASRGETCSLPLASSTSSSGRIANWLVARSFMRNFMCLAMYRRVFQIGLEFRSQDLSRLGAIQDEAARSFVVVAS